MEQQNSGKQEGGSGSAAIAVRKAEVIEILKSLEAIKRKLHALLK